MTTQAANSAPRVKYKYVGGTTWNFMKWADIPDARDETVVYLRRLRIVQTPWFAVYLHFIYQPDEDRDPHDHPFSFWSFIVRGGYVERVWPIAAGILRGRIGVLKQWRRFSLHRMPQSEAHSIETLQPGTITLVFAGRKRVGGRWGFYTPTGFTRWQDYNRAKYGPDFRGVDEWA